MSDTTNKTNRGQASYFNDSGSLGHISHLEHERYRTLIESTEDWLWEVDDKMIYTYVSPQVEKILGYSPDEVIGTSPFDYMPQDEGQRIAETCKEIVKTRRDLHLIENINLHKKGHKVHIETSGKAFYNDQGKFCGYRGVDRDISDRKIRQDESKIFTESMRQISEAALYLDAKGKIIYVNQTFFDLFGYTSEEILHKPISILSCPKMAGISNPKETLKALNEIGFWEGKTCRVTKAGKRLKVYLRARAVYEDDGKIKGYVSSYHDLNRHNQDEKRLRKTLKATIQAIANTIEKRDPYTFGHVNRVAQLSLEIAKEMGMSKDFLRGLEMGSLIHDIGKIYIPAEILNRPGKLSDNEMGMIKTHSEVGFDIVKDIDFPWPIKEMIRQHHERLDGSGYPDGLMDKEILPEAKIIAVADVMEAMSSHRPYRPALDPELALGELSGNKNTRYDAEVVDICDYLHRKKEFTFA